MPLPPTAHSAVKEAPPRIDVVDVGLAVKEQFGLEGEYSPLISERDQNFRLDAVNGNRYVVKVTSAGEAAIVSDFQIDALLHLEPVTTVQLPKVVRTIDGRPSGRIENGATACKLRLVSYVDGEPLASVPLNRNLARDFGTKLAALDIGLAGFSHPGECPVLLWDLQRAAELRDLLDCIDDASAREPVMRAIADFEHRVAPALPSLRSQVIHGDANPGNVLVDPSRGRVSGIIDFGDMVRAPLIIDVGIAAAYLRAGSADAIALIAPFVAGYHAVTPLLDDELALLFDLARARLATTITLLFWRLGARDENDPYRQKTLASEGGAIRFLNALDSIGRVTFLQRLERELFESGTEIR